MWYFIFGIVVGVLLGRAYGWMKYHYPESREMIAVKVARLRAERARYEYETEAARMKIDDLFAERLR
jgi:hypothetical protein